MEHDGYLVVKGENDQNFIPMNQKQDEHEVLDEQKH
jgi:hypothetical protein